MIYVLKITKIYLIHKCYSIIKFKDKIVTLKYHLSGLSLQKERGKKYHRY